MGVFTKLVDAISRKANRGQPLIHQTHPTERPGLRRPFTISGAYKDVPILNRAANMIIDSAAMCNYEVGDRINYEVSYGEGTKQKTLYNLLNYKPNPYMDINLFRRLVATDLLFIGSVFLHYDGKHLYHLPASLMTIISSKEGFIERFEFGDTTTSFKPSEIIFIRDNSMVNGLTSQLKAFSRVESITDSIKKREQMLQFKETFLDNGTVIGLILETDDILSSNKRKQAQESIQLDYNPSTGQSSVLILDGGLKAKPYSQISSFKDLDFKEDIARQEKDVSIALGVPQVLIDGGNNANIRPNIELFYYMTIIPMLQKVSSAIQFYFGYRVTPDVSEVQALTPDRDSQAKHLTALVNNGIMTGNEARTELGLEALDDEKMQTIRIPQNIAGSATGISGEEGGRPTGDGE